MVENVKPPAVAPLWVVRILELGVKTHDRSDGRPLRGLTGCGAKRRRGRKARDWYRPRSRDAKWALRFSRRGAVAARKPFVEREAQPPRRAALPRNTRRRFVCPRASRASSQWFREKFPRRAFESLPR